MATVMDMDTAISMEVARQSELKAMASAEVHGEIHETKGDERDKDASPMEAHRESYGKCVGLDVHSCECKEKKVKPGKSEARSQVENNEDEDDAAQGNEAVRSPSSSLSSSRLAASFLMGREKMVRVWREGTRRAGLFGSEDDDSGDEETKRDDEPSFMPRRSSVGQQSHHDTAVVVREIAPEDESSSLGDNQHDGDAVGQSVVSIQPRTTPRLVPSRVIPRTLVPKMAQLWMFLDRIECITIRDLMFDNEEDGAVYYILDVYHYQEQHNIPTQQQHRRAKTMTTHTPTRKPAYQLQQRFSSFTKLRSRVLKAAIRKHHSAPASASSSSTGRTSHTQCAYCSRIESFLTSGNDTIARLGWRAKMFTNTDARKALLSDFITELVFLAREHRDDCSVLRTLSAYQQPPARHVLRSVPSILKRFLTVQTGETFMR